MGSITDNNFKIPHIYATGYVRTFDSGANAPILARGIDMETNGKGDYVIKLKEGESMKDPSANLRELLAAFIAMEMDIPVVMPVLVEVTLPFVETITSGASKIQAQKSIGLNYGSVYVPEYPTITTGSLIDKLLPYAQNLFAFDLLIQNPDRNTVKPNMLNNGEEIIALDHEKAFAFIFAPFLPANLWEMKDVSKAWIYQHILYKLVKGKAFDFEVFSAKYANLNSHFWEAAEKLIPGEWKTQQFDTIKDTLNTFISMGNKFINEFKFIMS